MTTKGAVVLANGIAAFAVLAGGIAAVAEGIAALAEGVAVLAKGVAAASALAEGIVVLAEGIAALANTVCHKQQQTAVTKPLEHLNLNCLLPYPGFLTSHFSPWPWLGVVPLKADLSGVLVELHPGTCPLGLAM